MKDRISKLIAHEKSAREMGNINEAEAFKKKISELEERKENELREEQNNGNRWRCSCGYELVLAIDASAGSQVMADIMLAPHKRAGHQLELVK
jgi:hypothetical protein